MDTGLKNKHVLITGASGGIGSATAKKFAEEGAKLTLHYNTNRKKIEQLLNELNTQSQMVQADLRNSVDVENLFERSMETFGRIDVLIANAGVWPSKDLFIHEMELSQWENTIKTNLTSIFLCAKHFFLNLKKYPAEHGNIIMIGSTAGVFGEAGHVDYSASKAALTGLMLSLKNEIVHLARKGRVNIVSPGWTYTPMAEDSLKDVAMVKRVLQTIPLRKIATAEDIANTIVFLASDKLAGHISGQNIVVAGGMEGRVLFLPEEIDETRFLG